MEINTQMGLSYNRFKWWIAHKSSWCVKFKGDKPYVREGSSTIQLGGLNVHVISEAHKRSVQLLEIKWRKSYLPITKHVEIMLDIEKSRIMCDGNYVFCGYKRFTFRIV
jgi:hypothetical protein